MYVLLKLIRVSRRSLGYDYTGWRLSYNERINSQEITTVLFVDVPPWLKSDILDS